MCMTYNAATIFSGILIFTAKTKVCPRSALLADYEREIKMSAIMKSSRACCEAASSCSKFLTHFSSKFSRSEKCEDYVDTGFGDFLSSASACAIIRAQASDAAI